MNIEAMFFVMHYLGLDQEGRKKKVCICPTRVNFVLLTPEYTHLILPSINVILNGGLRNFRSNYIMVLHSYRIENP